MKPFWKIHRQRRQILAALRLQLREAVANMNWTRCRELARRMIRVKHL